MNNIIAFPFNRTAEGRAFEKKVDEYKDWAGERVNEGKYVPAYCDPENEFKGEKYKEEGYVDVAEIAKRIRKQINAKKKAGEYPKDLKVSVRISRYSMGQSIGATITAGLPDGINPEYIKIYNEEIARGETDWEAGRYASRVNYWAPEVAKIIEEIEDMGNTYRRDNSDAMSDYFDCNFYYNVNVDWQYRDKLAKAAGIK